MKQKAASEFTTISFVVQNKSTLLFDFIFVATANKKPEDCKELLLATGKYLSASVSDVFPNCLGNNINYTL